MGGSSWQPYCVAIWFSLTYLYPNFDNINADSLCAPREHSYQLLYFLSIFTGGRQENSGPEKEHTHIIKINLAIDKLLKKSYIIIKTKWKEHMTDKNKYRNVSLTHPTYRVLIGLSKVLLPDAKLSISKTIESLANEKAKRLNGKSKIKEK